MSQLQVTGEAKIRDIQGPVVANSGVITALDGAASQYVRGDGTLADFPTSTGGGSSVSYYLNSSVSQGTIGGVAYRELNKEPIIGAGTDITISANGYVASYITDANDPDVLSVPGGNFNCEFYFSVNNNTGNPTTYAELYKYDGTTFTLLGSSQAVPESLNQGTTIAPYYFAIPVATAALALTDRLAIRIYVSVDGRVVTLHTENSHLCQVVTTFSKGMVSLNNLTDQSQFITTGTSGTDFNIVSTGDTHTFNIPVASATNTGKLSNTDWSTFNAKQAALSFTAPLVNTSNTISIPAATSLVDGYLDNLDWVNFNTAYNDSIVSAAVTGTTTKTLTLNQQDGGTITASWTDINTDAVTSVFGRTGAVVAASGDYTTTQVTEGTNLYFTNLRAQNAITLTTTGTSGAATYSGGTLNIPQYQGVLTNPVTGTGTTNTLPKFTAASTIGNSNITDTGSLITLGSNTRINTGQEGLRIGADTNGVINSANTSKRGRINIPQYGNPSSLPIGIIQGATDATNNTIIIGGTQGGFALAADIITFQIGATYNATSGTEIARFASNGALGIGTTSLTNTTLRISKNITGATTSFGIVSDGQIQSSVTNIANIFSSNPSTQAATFNLGALVHYNATFSGIGAGNTINNQFGFLAENTLVGATNNFGFYGNIASGTNRWNIYMAGTAANYLAGALLIGTTTTSAFALDVNGTARMQDNLTVSKNQNATTQITISNTTSGTASEVSVNLTSSNGNVAFAKYSALKNTYKILNANDAFYYNGGSGDLAFLNDFATGTIKMAAGGSSTAQLTIASTGATTFTNSVTAASFIPTSSTIPTNGMYLSGTNTLGFATNGTLDMTLDANGALGLGTTSLTGYTLRLDKNITGSANPQTFLAGGTIQTDATGVVILIGTSLQTVASANSSNVYHYNTGTGSIGAGTVIGNLYGYVASGLTQGTNNFGFYGNISAAANRYNLYMNGTANNYMAGSLGIGSTSLTGYTLRLSKSLTGSTSTFAARNEGLVLSDVTADAIGFRNDSNTQAAAFTLTNYWHFWARQGSIGAGSAITNQYGYVVDSNMIGATNNYAFQGNIPSGTNRWNLYMAGTAANYMAGTLLIGGTTNSNSVAKLQVYGSTTASSANGQLRISDSANAYKTLSLGFDGTNNLGFIQSFEDGVGYRTLAINSQGGNVIIGGTSSNASAKVQIDSTTQGFLPPRGTNAQRLAITSPAVGLIFYCTDATEGLYIYTSTGWRSLTMV